MYDENELRKRAGAVLARYREKHNLTQIEAADRLDMSQATISCIEAEKPEVSLRRILTVMRLAVADAEVM